jgi:hypothetical protein
MQRTMLADILINKYLGSNLGMGRTAQARMAIHSILKIGGSDGAAQM